jgi:hypothetical protein
MIDRSFSETDLRTMLEDATGIRPDALPGRWKIDTFHNRQAWIIVVEPNEPEHILKIVTAFKIN